ncbi:hypothetical protein [Vagococcus sp.]|uniref:hypothetical protein n=1 Tax=Vagococcus sp. TaxID=1933889 RepID=UPI003F9D3DB6
MTNDKNLAAEQIVKSILAQGKIDNQKMFEEEKNKIEAAYEQEKAFLMKEKQDKLKQVIFQFKNNFEKEIQREHVNRTRQVVAEEQRYLTKLFKEVTEELDDLTIEEQLALFIPVFKKNTLEGQIEVIVGEASKKALTQEKLTEFNAFNPKVTYQLSKKELPSENGFILSQDGIEYNYTLSSILADVKEQAGVRYLEKIRPEEG